MTGFWRRLLAVPPAELAGGLLLVFVASAFALPNEAAYGLAFYILAAIGIVCLARGGPPRLTWDRGLVLAFLLIAWSGLTLLWGHDDNHRSMRFALGAACTALFVAAALLAWHGRPASWRRLGTMMIWAALPNAILAMARYPFTPAEGDRLHGWGVTSHPILGASTMTMAYLAALSRGLAERRFRAAHLAAAGVMAAFVLLTESRGPLGAALAATLFLCAAGPWRWRALAALAALAVGWKLVPAGVRQHQAAMLVARGSSHRFEIWQRTLEMVRAHPVLGNGLAANVDLPGMTFPHDLYLSVLFYSGAVGLVLFAALAGLVSWRLWRAPRDLPLLWVAALWINTLISGLTDLGQITKGPGPMWFIFWVPVCLVLARRSADAEQPRPLSGQPVH